MSSAYVVVPYQLLYFLKLSSAKLSQDVGACNNVFLGAEGRRGREGAWASFTV
jgi:hypothetical protein